jgi:hypothetical protein
MRKCVEMGCEAPVGGLRSRRCDEHKRLRRNAQERARYQQNGIDRSPEGRARLYDTRGVCDGSGELAPVIDYTRRGVRPASPDSYTPPAQYATRPATAESDLPVIDYTKGGTSSPIPAPLT